MLLVFRLCAVLETRRDFELVQSYMATFFNAHAGELWSVGGDELTQVLLLYSAHPMNYYL